MAGVIVAFGVAWRVNSTAAAVANAPTNYIAPATLDSLGRYLRPIALTSARARTEPAELFAREDYYVQPGGIGDSDGAAATSSAGEPWVVSAILVTDAQRMAIVNNSVVQVGSALAGGARVVEIQPNRVVLHVPGSGRRVISLNR